MGRGGKILVALAVGVPVVAIAIAALNAPREEPKSYHFSRVDIEATIEPDGDLVLTERRTFDFRGDFSFAFFTIEPVHAPPENILGFTVHDGDQELQVFPSVEDGGHKATWYFDAHDEQRTFTIGYKVRCAVDVYEDGAHLLWQFIGTGWTEPTDLATITVRLPGAATDPARRDREPCPAEERDRPFAARPLARGEAKAWGHGPFNGSVRFQDPQTVRFEVGDLPPATFVEGSVLLPAEAVPFAHQVEGPRRAAILAEEQDLADRANSLRRRHRFELGLTRALYWLTPLLILGLILLARRRDRVPGVPKHLEQPPEDLHPAELAVLWSAYRKRLSPKNAYRAQLLHLARTGAVELQPVGTVSDPADFLVRARDGAETTADRSFLRFLVEDGGTPGDPLLSRIRARGPRKEQLQGWWKAVGGKTSKAIGRMVLGRSRLESYGIAAVGWGAAVYGWWRWTGFETDGLEPVGFVGIPAAWLLPIGAGSWFLGKWLLPPRLGLDMRRRMQRWAAFRRFLKGFSSLPDAPALAVTVWEHYLVYAVALGVGDRVARQVRALVPADELEGPWPGAPAGDMGSHYFHRVGGTSAHSPANAASTVGWTSGWGSSSGGGGGGGGFSGGGGGGGGGTGGGAG